MKISIATLICVLSTVLTKGQGYQIDVLIQDLPDQTVYLSAFYKSEYIVEDSAQSMHGSFYFHRSEKEPRGMYRLEIYSGSEGRVKTAPRFIEFIWGNESFSIFSEYSNEAAPVYFDNSEENSLMEEYRSFEFIYEEKLDAIIPLLDKYPEEDGFINDARQHFLKIQREKDRFIQNLQSSYSELLASKIIASNRTPLLQPEKKGQERIVFLQKHFFDFAPLNEPELLRVPVYNKKIIEYLKLFSNRNFSFSEQEDSFILAVDIIMANVSGDSELRGFVVEYLLEGFESFGMEKIQTYIIDTYVDETCETDAIDLAVERVLGYRKMAVGETAKDIYIRSFGHTMARLSEVDADYVLVLFWATYCEHCAGLIPKIQSWYESEKPDNLEIFSVSIDTIETDWVKYSEMKKLPWINTHEPMGWEGKSAEDFNVYATPTMFLLDRRQRILAKPFTFRDLIKDVRKLR